jgi:hypothetical protein
VLAANAAYQQYSTPGRFNGAYVPHEYDVLRAGAVPLSSMTYLVAVQAVVRGEAEPPSGLGSSQRDEVIGWMKALAGERVELKARLGVSSSAQPGAREIPVLFVGHETVVEATPPRIAFRWQTNRGGVGLVAGTVIGMGLAFILSRGLLPLTAFGGAAAGHVIGRRVRAPRCSACATVVPPDAARCPKCGASLRGDIANLSDRLEAEEDLEETSST